jgi:D-glycero-D-manno-heptose 1,7-bisphosphate phosphatase
MKNAPPQEKSPAVFLDRDGTLMHDADYCGDPKDVDLFSDVPDALQRLKDRGYKLIVITNQSGIGRGYFSETQYRDVEAEVARQIGHDLIDATYFCPHLPGHGCECRKPSPKMIFDAARDHDIDLGRSFLIGDKKSDMDCGRNAGVKTILVRTGYGKESNETLADFVAHGLKKAADIILHATPY